MRGGRWLVGWVVGYLLGMLVLRLEWRMTQRRIWEGQCRIVAAAGGLYTLPCPGCGGSHR